MIMISVLSVMGGLYSLLNSFLPVPSMFNPIVYHVFNLLSGVTMLAGSSLVLTGFTVGRPVLISGYILALLWLLVRIYAAPLMLNQIYLQIAFAFALWFSFSIYIAFGKKVREYFNPNYLPKKP
jgi:hypothetical protein